MTDLKISFNPLAFPWDKGEKPVLINELGWEWYPHPAFDEKYMKRKMGGLPKKKWLSVYYVRRGDDVNIVAVNNGPVHDTKRLEDMFCFVDAWRLSNRGEEKTDGKEERGGNKLRTGRSYSRTGR